MPGAGKSTIGLMLARQTSRDFVDTDLLIQNSQGRTLQDILDADGYSVLRKIEEEILLGLSLYNCVIATGGSAVYSNSAMVHLRSNGILIFLDVDLPRLESRVDNFETRGIAGRPNQNLLDLFEERLVLYAKYADITIKSSDLTQEEVCAKIIRELEVRNLRR